MVILPSLLLDAWATPVAPPVAQPGGASLEVSEQGERSAAAAVYALVDR